MIRILIASLVLAGSIAASVLSEPAPRYAVPAPRPGGNTVRARPAG